MNAQSCEFPVGRPISAANEEPGQALARILSITRNCWAGEEDLPAKSRIGVGLGQATPPCDEQAGYSRTGEHFEALMTVRQTEAGDLVSEAASVT